MMLRVEVLEDEAKSFIYLNPLLCLPIDLMSICPHSSINLVWSYVGLCAKIQPQVIKINSFVFGLLMYSIV